MDNYLLISDAAKEVQVESHVLRYWEEELHLPIHRNELGHRYYTREDVERLKQIKEMKERGLQLKAIKMILKDGKLDVMIPEAEKEALRQQEAGGACRQQEEGEAHGQQEEEEACRQQEGGGTCRQQEAGEACRQQEGSGIRRKQEEEATERGKSTAGLAVGVAQDSQVSAEGKEEKARRLQWLLQQMIRETIQENNRDLCREIRESVVKELDYQFRAQEEREEEWEKIRAEREEQHYQKLDELLRAKNRRPNPTFPGKKKAEPRKKKEIKEGEKMEMEVQETGENEVEAKEWRERAPQDREPSKSRRRKLFSFAGKRE